MLSVSFASPAIVKAWKLAPAALGIVLSMELVGMAIGSLTLWLCRRPDRPPRDDPRVPDRDGSWHVQCGCRGQSRDASHLPGPDGLGIGGMPAAINAAVAEAPNSARRSLCIVLMAAGYPLGTGVGGSVSPLLLAYFDWPAIFVFGVS